MEDHGAIPSSDKTQIALHFDKFVGVVRFKGALEVEGLIALLAHLLGLLLEDVVLPVGRLRGLEVASAALRLRLVHAAQQLPNVVLLVPIVHQRDFGLRHRI